MRLRVIFAAVAAFAAVGVVVGFSTAEAEPDQPSASETIVVDGVTVYRAERADGEATYETEPLTAEELAEFNAGPFGDPYGFVTTGDLAGCKLLAARPGNVNDGCAVILAMEGREDLDPAPGSAQIVHGVCGPPPGPGEVEQCEGQVASEADVSAANQQMRDALAPD